MNSAKRLEFYLNTIENSLKNVENYLSKIEILLPITENSYEEIEKYHKEIIDAIAFRFSKIQSLLGEKVFRLFLENIGYDLNEKSFLEILSELEKLNILRRTEWIRLREIRNKISHEYPDEIYEIIDNLNMMIESFEVFRKILNKIKEYNETFKK
ncbi:hypothetical protein [Caminibacter sp.]